jgi:hypothetical protein
MIMNLIPVFLLFVAGILYFDPDEPVFEDRFSVTQDLLTRPGELLSMSEMLQHEGNIKGAFLCWKLLKETNAPWEFRAPALLKLSSYYLKKGKKGSALECLRLVKEQEEILPARLAAQERYEELESERFFLSDDEL